MKLLDYFKNQRLNFNYLLFLWVSIHLILWFKIGPKEGADTSFYISIADNILNGKWLFDRSLWYSSYGLFISIFRFFTEDISPIILGQLFINLLSGYCFYQLLIDRTQKEYIAFLGTATYLFFPISIEWHYIVYGESFFTSFTILFFYCYIKKIHRIALPLLFFTFFIRPIGIIFLSALIISKIYFLYKNEINYRRTILVGSSLIFFFLLCVINKMLQFYGPLMIDGYLNAEIIYPKHTLGISPLENPYLPSNQENIIIQILLTFFGNFGYMVKLMVIKSLLFWGNMKPYYSFTHNLIIAFTLYPLYFLLIKNNFNKDHWTFISTSSLLYILFQGGVISLTSENWDGRFLYPLIPFLIYLSTNSSIKKPVLKKSKQA
ncbi:hypothetical protein [Flammeovirga pacifica]|uniref:Glycosyltransferase RgtA/B/C/D-like domain-containing protein n=1 Tax=Flammeovirga pacifica TaxID=915059 RepID=A0A1S1Z2U4_FLAPC|nr:hypothetical protein [Flammeovirga pacifica]OHX67590.1 hypothetical protein NH26_15150 [Flammeovirga pacifica]